MDLSRHPLAAPLAADAAAYRWPVLLAAAAGRAAATPTALCQARLPVRTDPGEVAFDAAVAAVIAAWRTQGRGGASDGTSGRRDGANRMNVPFTPPL